MASATNGYITNSQLEYFKESLKQIYANKNEVYDKIEADKTFLKKGEATKPLEHTHIPATLLQDGFMTKEDKAKLNSIANGANNYVHPDYHSAEMIVQDENHRFVTDAQLNIIEGKYKIEKIKNEDYNKMLREGKVDLNTLYLLVGVAENQDAIVGIYFGNLPCIGGYLPRYIPVERIVLDKLRFNVEAGSETWIGASVYPSISSFRMLDYEYDNSIIEVNEYGKIRAVKTGHTFVTIKAKDNPSIFNTISVTVNKAIADEMYIDEEDGIELTVGHSLIMKAKVLPSNASGDIYWTTSDRDVAIIDRYGKVTGLESGSCYINGYTKDGTAIKDSLLINVVDKIIYSEELLIHNLENNMYIGDRYTLDYTIIPRNVSNNKIKLISSNTDVLEVFNTNYAIYAKNAGESILSIKTDDGKVNYGDIKIKVNKIPIDAEKVELVMNDSDVYLGSIFGITYNVFPANAYDYTVNVEVDCENQIEKIDENSNMYRFIALNQGTATIKVTVLNKNNEVLCRDLRIINILKQNDDVPALAIKLDRNKLIINKDTEHAAKLTYSIAPINATNKQVHWRSSNNSVVTVDPNGNLTAHSYGTAMITCSLVYHKYSSSCEVIVTGDQVPVSTVTLLMEERSKKILIGEKYKLPTVVYPNDAYNKKLNYQSSDNNIATVLEDGTVIGITKGVCKITATSVIDPLKSIDCVVTVVGSYKDILANIIRIENQLLEVDKDGKLQLRTKILPVDATDQELTWSSSNNSIAIVNEKGMVFGKKEGSCKIRAYNKASGVETFANIKVVSDNIDKSEISEIIINDGYTKKCSAYNVFTQDFEVVPTSLSDSLILESVESDHPFVAGADDYTVICQNVDGFTLIRSKFENGMDTNLQLFVSKEGTLLKNFKIIPELMTILKGETVKPKFQCEPYNFPFDRFSVRYEVDDPNIIEIDDNNCIVGKNVGTTSITAIYEELDMEPVSTVLLIKVIDNEIKYNTYDNILVNGNIATIYNGDYYERYLLYSEQPHKDNNYLKINDNETVKYLRLSDDVEHSLFVIDDDKKPTSGFVTNIIPRYNFRYGDITNIHFKKRYTTKDLTNVAQKELERVNKNFKLIETEDSTNIVEEARYNDTWNGLTESTINKYGFVDSFEMFINQLNYEINEDTEKILRNVTLHEFLHVLGFDDFDDEDQTEMNKNSILSYYRNKLACDMLQPTDVYTLVDMYGLEMDVTDLHLGSGYKLSSTKLVGSDNDMTKVRSFSYDGIPEDLLSIKSDIVIVGFADKIETKKINIGGSRIMEYDVVTFLISEVEKGEVGDSIEVKFPVDKINIELGENYLLYLKKYNNVPASTLNLTNAIKKL